MSAWETLRNTPKWKNKLNYALQLSLNKLSNFEEEFAIRQIERAIESGWTGVVFTGTERDYQEWLNIKYGKTGIQGQNNRNADKAAKARMLLDEYAAIEQGSSAIDHQTDWPFYLFEWSVSISVNTCICFKAISFLSYQHQSPLRWTVPLKASRRLLIYMTFHSSFCASVNTPLSIVMYGILLLLSNLDLQISFTYYISVFSVNDIFSFSLNEKIAQTRIFNLI